jgi:uncharacterized protein
MSGLRKLALVLVVIGALNWLLVGLFGLNVVEYLGSTIARIVYILVGLSGIIIIFTPRRSSPSGM